MTMRGAFENIVKCAACGATVAFLYAAPATAQEELANVGLGVSLTVIIDPLKTNGQPWDGYPAVGDRVIVADASNAPDLAVCVVLATGLPDCIWRTERSRKVSHCPDAETCIIPGMLLPNLPFGLIFLDLDLVRHDLIDFVILADAASKADDLAKVEKNLQATMARLTPGETPGERERRKRKAQVLPIGQCMGAKATCDLSQSRFRLEQK